MIKAVSNFKQSDSNYNLRKGLGFNTNNSAQQFQQISFAGLNVTKAERSILRDVVHSSLGKIKRIAKNVYHSTTALVKHLKGQDKLPIAQRPVTAEGFIIHDVGGMGVPVKVPVDDAKILKDVDGKHDAQGNYFERTGDGTVKADAEPTSQDAHIGSDDLTDDGIGFAPESGLSGTHDLENASHSLDLDPKLGVSDVSADGLTAELGEKAPEIDLNLRTHLGEIGLDPHDIGFSGGHVDALELPHPDDVVDGLGSVLDDVDPTELL